MKKTAFALSLFLMLLLASCSHSFNSTLSDANLIMEAAPDSALTLLGEIDTASLQSESDRAFYNLLSTQARVKCDVPVTSDSLISASAAFFSQNGPDSLAMRALFYQGIVLRDNGDNKSAINPLADAYDLAVKMGNYYWRAKSAEAMAFVYSSTYCRDEATSMVIEASECYGQSGNYLNQLYSLVDLGICYSNNGEYGKAKTLLDSVYFRAENLSDTALMAYANSAIFSLSIQRNDYEEAAFRYKLLEQMSKFYTLEARDYAWAAELGFTNGDNSKVKSFFDYVNTAKLEKADKLTVFSTLLWLSKKNGNYQEALKYSDSLALYQNLYVEELLKQSVISSQFRYAEKKLVNVEYTAKKKILLLSVIGCIIVLLLVVMILFYRMRLHLKKHELDRTVIEVLRLSEMVNKISLTNKNLSDTLECRVQDINTLEAAIRKHELSVDEKIKNECEIAELNREVEALFRNKWILLNKLCNEYFEKENTVIAHDIIAKNIKSEIDSIRNQNNFEIIKGAVNKYMGGVVDSLECQCPFLKREEIHFLTLVIAGFSAKSVCIFLGIRLKNFYAKRKV